MDLTQPGRDEWERPGAAADDEGATEEDERLRNLNRYQLAAALIGVPRSCCLRGLTLTASCRV